MKANFSQFGIHKIEVRGEVLLEVAMLEKMNAERTKQNEIFPHTTLFFGYKIKIEFLANYISLDTKKFSYFHIH